MNLLLQRRRKQRHLLVLFFLSTIFVFHVTITLSFSPVVKYNYGKLSKRQRRFVAMHSVESSPIIKAPMEKDNSSQSHCPQKAPLSSYSILRMSSTNNKNSSPVDDDDDDDDDVQDAWEKLCPPILNNNIWNLKSKKHTRPNVDVTIVWNKKDNVQAVAQELLHRCHKDHAVTLGSSNKNSKSNLHQLQVQSLTESLQAFRDFCLEYMDNDKMEFFKARIVATRGSAGTKCPQWHVDHVPVRWIQSLKGPGCDFLTSEKGIHWNAFFNDDDDDHDNDKIHSLKARNQARVDSQVATIYSAKEKEGILLVGNGWKEFAKTKSLRTLPPVVHKSPSDIPYWQGRVLLTQDVLVD